MSSNLVIVAIPDENDRVWKISSEKVPHLTLLFLGEVDNVTNLDQIIQFVEHAANTTLRRFYLPVDRRGELGADQADVLFFKKGRYDYKAIRDFRAALLQDNNIKTAYDSATQFDGPWNPHLTLGYPATPAKSIPDDQFPGIYDVSFNKVAVWTGDFEGVEFLLKDYADEFEALDSVPMDVAMSELEHVGIKGMRWGVRKQDVTSGAKAVGRAAKSTGGALGKAAEATGRFAGDVHFESQARPQTRKTPEGETIEMASRARELVIKGADRDFRSKDLATINAKPEYAKARKLRNRLTKPLDKTTRAYRSEVKQAYINRLETTANSMKNPSGTREYTIRERGGDLPRSKYYWEVSTREARHAEGDDFTLLEVLMDEDGFITGVKKADSIEQTMELGEAFLAHYGVKGMKWGVRNVDRTTGRTTETKREGLQRYLDPQGHDVSTDVAKFAVGYLVPVVAPLTWPAQIRLIRGGARGIKAKAIDRQEKKFEKKAMSPKNFVAIHNGALDQINRNVDAINKKYPGDLTKNPSQRKKYDAEVLKVMQDGYRASANSLSNKAQTRHLDVEFVNDGLDFKIHAREGAPTPLPVRVKHADDDIGDEEITVEITGKIKRDATGHIVGFEFDHLKSASMGHSTELGEAFILKHYGIKGMRWGVRKQQEVSARSLTDTGILKRKTRVRTEGGVSHPAHTDAVKAAVQKQKLKKSGTDALSTQELRELANRLQVENQVAILTSSKGRQFVSREFETTTKGLAREGFRKGAPLAGTKVAKSKVGKKVRKGAATAAVTALI